MKYCSSFPKSAHIGQSSDKKTLKKNLSDDSFAFCHNPSTAREKCWPLKAMAPAAAQHLYFHRVLQSKHPKDPRHHKKKPEHKAGAIGTNSGKIQAVNLF